jgi:hypothetical protein
MRDAGNDDASTSRHKFEVAGAGAQSHGKCVPFCPCAREVQILEKTVCIFEGTKRQAGGECSEASAAIVDRARICCRAACTPWPGRPRSGAEPALWAAVSPQRSGSGSNSNRFCKIPTRCLSDHGRCRTTGRIDDCHRTLGGRGRVRRLARRVLRDYACPWEKGRKGDTRILSASEIYPILDSLSVY